MEQKYVYNFQVLGQPIFSYFRAGKNFEST